MNGTRIALVGLVAACAWAAWPKREIVIDTQRISRQLVVWRTLARVDDPIVILGDSIVEASTLPRSLCGHPIVNAGVGGATTASNLGSFLADALGDKQAALVVVSLGGNDAAVSDSVERYRSAYRALLTELKALTPRRAMVGISPVEAGLEDGKKISGADLSSGSTGSVLLVTQCTRSGHTAMPPFSPASRLSSARSSSPRSRSRLK